MQPRKTPEEIELETLQDAATRTTTSRAQVQQEISSQVQEFLRNGGRIQQIRGATAASWNFNVPVSERSSRIAETFRKREKKPPHNKKRLDH